MHYVYILKSIKNGKIYCGQTKDLAQRLSDHNSGNNYSTQFDRPYKIVYYEAYLEEKEAFKREKALKHHGSSIGH